MRIGSKSYEIQHPPREIRGHGTTGGTDPASAGVAPKAAHGGVKVDVSSEAQRLAAEGAVDTAKIERLRTAIADGSFVVDSAAVAKRLVETGG
ncbi:MAG: flagellar biosynthesis anti-sigma factor FlgM [Myxococcales bacterium]|nr:flagellar biosynthesis anti-sigma factor FlgM [Myxococcales bacterium]